MFCKLIPKRWKKSDEYSFCPLLRGREKEKPWFERWLLHHLGQRDSFSNNTKAHPITLLLGSPLFFRAYVIAGSKRCSMCQRRRCQPGWHFRVFRGPVAAAAEIFYKQENHSTNIFSRHGSNVHHRAAAAAGQRALFISWRGGIKKEEGGKIKHLKRPRRK